MEEKKNAWGRTSNIPINEKYMLSIREASDYFGIGIKNMRRLAENNTNKFALYFGNRYAYNSKCCWPGWTDKVINY